MSWKKFFNNIVYVNTKIKNVIFVKKFVFRKKITKAYAIALLIICAENYVKLKIVETKDFYVANNMDIKIANIIVHNQIIIAKKNALKKDAIINAKKDAIIKANNMIVNKDIFVRKNAVQKVVKKNVPKFKKKITYINVRMITVHLNAFFVM